jgi:16S rRNA (guanine(1405)-N(7))-methyltransferase
MENSIEHAIGKANKIRLLAKEVVAKKELSNLNEEFVVEKINEYLEKHRELSEKLEQKQYKQFKRSKEHEITIKKIRAGLREIYGVFILENYTKRHELLEELRKNPSLKNLEAHNRILELHQSSKERLPYYGFVYKKIFEITGIPKRIVDLACGLNPISYPYLGCKPEYLGCDLAEKDLEFIKEYFAIMGIKGSVKKVDLTKNNAGKIVKGTDIVFLFKTLDSLESIKWNISQELLKRLKAKFVVVSFATKSLGGKKAIRKERRAWFERLVKEQKYAFESFEIPGEVFYVLTSAS